MDARPVEDRERISVEDRETVAENVRPLPDLLLQIVELLAQRLAGRLLEGIRRRGVPERAEALVKLGGDEVEPFELAIAVDPATRQRERGVRCLIGEILEDHRILGQDIAVVELQRRDSALRIDVVEAPSVGGALAGELDLDELDRKAGLAGDDMGCLRAGSGGVIKLHLSISWSVSTVRLDIVFPSARA